MTKFRATSGGFDPPGAPGLTSGTMLASTSGLVLTAAVVVGSEDAAPSYRKMALFMLTSSKDSNPQFLSMDIYNQSDSLEAVKLLIAGPGTVLNPVDKHMSELI
jgi:hypothetical protein